MRVGFDLDGVLYNWHASLRQHLGLDESVAPDPTEWSFHEAWGMTLEDFLQAAHEGVDADVIFSWGDPLPGAEECLARVKAVGHTIHIVTDRRAGSPGNAQSNTMRWLHKHGLPYDTVTFARDKTIADVDLFIDDKVENYDAMARAGKLVYLLDRPWNQVEESAPFRRRRIGTLEEYAVIAEHLTPKALVVL